MVIKQELKSTVKFFEVEVLHNRKLYKCVVDTLKTGNNITKLKGIEIQTPVEKRIKQVIINIIKNHFV